MSPPPTPRQFYVKQLLLCVVCRFDFGILKDNLRGQEMRDHNWSDVPLDIQKHRQIVQRSK
jgi:hypothetical protein